MDKSLAKILVDCIDDAGLYENYSGRGMYGGQTTGVVVSDLADALSYVIENADMFTHDDELGVYPAFDTVKLRSDSLGLQTILY